MKGVDVVAHILKEEKVDYLYIPIRDEILLDIDNSKQLPWGFNNMLCGKFRKNHFNGVYTIVKKLFEIIKPTYVFFGEKDYQQTILIKYIIENYFEKIKIVICPTIPTCPPIETLSPILDVPAIAAPETMIQLCPISTL